MTVEGVSSAIKLVVDGEGPEFRVFSPQPGSNLPSAVVNFSFDVRDDGAGLRHDGEFEGSGDGDSRPVNPDGDQLTSNEPRSTADGGAADIHAYLSREGGDATDITPYGTSLWEVTETGAAYALSVDVNVGSSGSFDLEFEATDRAGNTTIEDAADVAVVLPTATPTPPPGSTPTPSQPDGTLPTATPTPMPGTVTPTASPQGQGGPTATPTPMPGSGSPTPQPSNDNVPTPTPTPRPGDETSNGQSPDSNLPTPTPTPRPGEGTSDAQSSTAHLPTITPTPRPRDETPSTQPPDSNLPTPTPTPTPSTPPDPQAWLEAWLRAWQAWLVRLLAGFFQ